MRFKWKLLDRPDHPTTFRRFWLTAFPFYQSIKWDGNAVSKNRRRWSDNPFCQAIVFPVWPVMDFLSRCSVTSGYLGFFATVILVFGEINFDSMHTRAIFENIDCHLDVIEKLNDRNCTWIPQLMDICSDPSLNPSPKRGGTCSPFPCWGLGLGERVEERLTMT